MFEVNERVLAVFLFIINHNLKKKQDFGKQLSWLLFALRLNCNTFLIRFSNSNSNSKISNKYSNSIFSAFHDTNPFSTIEIDS